MIVIMIVRCLVSECYYKRRVICRESNRDHPATPGRGSTRTNFISTSKRRGQTRCNVKCDRSHQEKRAAVKRRAWEAGAGSRLLLVRSFFKTSPLMHIL